MRETGESLRRALASARPSWNPAGYPPELRARATRWLRERRAEGAPWSELVETLGLSRTTVQGWAEDTTSKGSFLPVSVSSASAAVGLVLVTPRGYRVEGLDAETLSRLLERLA